MASWSLPTSHIDVDGDWNDETLVYDGVSDTWGYPDNPGLGNWTGYVEFYHDAVICDTVKFQLSISTLTAAPAMVWQVEKDGSWETVWAPSAIGSGWHEVGFAEGVVTGMRFKFRRSLAWFKQWVVRLDWTQFYGTLVAVARTYYFLA